MKEFITIGKISENCKSLIIYCGDYTSDDTTECTFTIINNKISSFDNDFSYHVGVLKISWVKMIFEGA